jgi:phosphoribosylanthranilate isomerase
MLFTVKICGLTTPDDAALAAAAGADAIGLNFVAGSPRVLGVAQARAVAAAVPPGVLKVGVFAGATAAEIRRIAEAVGLDAVQLHGHLEGEGPGVDPPTLCAELAGLTIIRAVRLEPGRQAGRLPHMGRPSRSPEAEPHVGRPSRSPEAEPHHADDPLAAARAWLAAAAALGHPASMAIVDAPVTRGTAPGHLGGTGATADWAAFARARPLGLPTALAGGLTPDNVAEAIRASMAAAVDTASGVESAPGRKDPEKLRAFVAAAGQALEATAKVR